VLLSSVIFESFLFLRQVFFKIFKIFIFNIFYGFDVLMLKINLKNKKYIFLNNKYFKK